MNILAMLLAGSVLSLPADGVDESTIALKRLSDGSIIEYESSFCGVSIGEAVYVLLMGDTGDAASAEIVAASVKPEALAAADLGEEEHSARSAYVTAVIGVDARAVEITLDEAAADWSNVHLQIEISSGDKLGVNLRSAACERREAAGSPGKSAFD